MPPATTDQEVQNIDLFPKQDEFIFDEAKFSGYGGGYGNGKTLAGCIKVWQHCQTQPNAYFLIGRKYGTTLRGTTQNDFLELCHTEGTFSTGTQTFTFFNGAKVIFRPLDDLFSLTNYNLSGFWIDQAEEVEEVVFDRLAGRLRRKCDRREGFITFNMEGHNWIWRRFKALRDVDDKPLDNPEAYHLVEATTLENASNLPDDYIKSLMAMPKDYVERYVYGSWENFAGKIFTEFNYQINVVPSNKMFPIPNTWERLRAIDHGQNNPTACLWAGVDFEGNIWIFQEYYQPSRPVSQHTKSINEMSLIQTPSGYIQDHYTYTVMDPSTHAKTREKNGYLFSVADEYMEAGIPTVKGQNDVRAGINRVNEYLQPRDDRPHPWLLEPDNETPKQGAPRLYIFERCEKLIEEIRQYKWKPPRIMSEENDKEQPLKKDDHAVDALRYLIMSRPATPEAAYDIPAWVYADNIELARRAKELGRSPQELLAARFKRHSVIKHIDREIPQTNAAISFENREDLWL